MVLRGTCEMMVGKCTEGKQRIRSLPYANAIAADAAMKAHKWEKKKFRGEEIREKTLGRAGRGRKPLRAVGPKEGAPRGGV